jgi:hypothetical protein
MGRHRKFCACGCGEPVKLRRNTWLRGHVPLAQIMAQRAAASRSNVFKIRSERFRQDLDRLGKRITREDLMALLADVYDRGYQAAYQMRKREEKRDAA